MLMNTE